MSDFQAKMHNIRFPLGSALYIAGGTYSAPPDPVAVFEGPTSKGKEVKAGEERERRGKRRGGGGNDLFLAHPKKFAWRPYVFLCSYEVGGLVLQLNRTSYAVG